MAISIFNFVFLLYSLKLIMINVIFFNVIFWFNKAALNNPVYQLFVIPKLTFQPQRRLKRR